MSLLKASKSAALVRLVAIAGILLAGAVVRAEVVTYYISADKVAWDYAPLGGQACYGPDDEQDLPDPIIVGGVFAKARYQEYTDDTFETLKERPDEWQHLGILGPLIQANIGDTVIIVFKNNVTFDVSLEPMGAAYWDSSALPAPGTPLSPGQVATYNWTIPPEAGPTESPKTRLYLYRPFNPLVHDYTGLVGPILITNPAIEDPYPIDHTRVLIYQIYSEFTSPYFPENVAVIPPVGLNYVKFALNGYPWCNAQGFNFTVGERVRWHVGIYGGIQSVHVAHWHGNPVTDSTGRYTDSVNVFPGTTTTADMHLDSAGTWLMHCHINDHFDKGMSAMYNVAGDDPVFDLTGETITYYIAAEEGEWDYTPLGGNACGAEITPVPLPEEFQGFKFLKARYIEYTDASFTTPKVRPASEEHLGILGPTLRAKVGDTLKIVYLNNASFSSSLHPHGVWYSKTGEGAPYLDGTSGDAKLDDLVVPGANYTYTWLVPPRSGPGPTDLDSIIWLYHSHSHETHDTNAGLIGAIIISSNTTSPPGAGAGPNDVADEFVVFMSEMDEGLSSLTLTNLERLYPGLNDPDYAALLANATFLPQLYRPSVNGLSHCNLPGLNFTQGALERLHLEVLGSMHDKHGINLGTGGNFFTAGGLHEEAVYLGAGNMRSADVRFLSPGTWRTSDGNSDQIRGGMIANYTVTPVGLGQTPSNRTRNYYLQAEKYLWDYAPAGYQPCRIVDDSATAALYLTSNASYIGSKYYKARFVEYSNYSFVTPIEQPEWYGILGPLLVAEVGDILRVVFKNTLDFPVSFSPGFTLLSNGGNIEGASVHPGEVYTYVWQVPPEAGPGPGELSTVAYSYMSATDLEEHPQLGLMGPMLVGQPGTFPSWSSKTPTGVNKVVPLLIEAVNENKSPYLADSAALAGTNLSAPGSKFKAANMRHSINGFSYCNLPNLTLFAGTTVRWIVMGGGGDEDFHGPAIGGLPLNLHEGPQYAAEIAPGVVRIADSVPRLLGNASVRCETREHVPKGEIGKLLVVE